MYKIVVCVLCSFLSVRGYGQLSSLDVGFSLGNQQSGEVPMVHLTPSVGEVVKDLVYVHGGFDVGFYRFTDVETDSPAKSAVIPFALMGGARYNLQLWKHKKGTPKEKKVGVFFDPRIYFSPLLPRTVTYEDYDHATATYHYPTVKGDFKSQLSYGLGFGLYFMDRILYRYWALKIENTAYDPFQELRSLDFPDAIHLPSRKRTVISLSLLF